MLNYSSSKMHSAMLVCLFVLQCFAWTSSFVYRPCWTRRPATRNRILEKVQLTNSRLYSTKLRWEQIPPHIEDEQLDADGSPKLSALTGGHPAVTIDVDTLVQQWIDTCLAEGRASDADKFSLKSAIPLLTKKNTVVQLVNATLEASQAQDKSVTYISEEELKKLWVDGSYRAMGKPASGYSVQDALLLMDDGDELELLESAGKDDQLAVDDKEEVIITHQELERVWANRAEIPWGMPAEQFDLQKALMLLDTEDEDVPDEVEILTRGLQDHPIHNAVFASPSGVSSKHSDGTTDVVLSAADEYISGHEAALLPPDYSVSERMAFFNKYPGRSNQYLRETLRRIHDDLEDTPNHSPAWKKQTNMLTPDIETQQFMGDIMFSNTYLTQRIPANWDDPEADEMTEIYNSTATMAWPGQPETDFNAVRPMWEELQLPIGPQYARGKGLLDTLREQIEADNALQRSEQYPDEQHDSAETSMPIKVHNKEEVDWANFDFSSTDDRVVSTTPNLPGSGDDLDMFFETFSTAGAGSAADSTSAGAVAEPNYDDLSSAENSARRRALFQSTAVNGISSPGLVEPPFSTPEEYLTQEEFKDHVGFEVWSTYNNKGFEEVDDVMWDDDVYTAQALKHLIAVTDEYLDDHKAAVVAHDEQKHWGRVMRNAFLGENVTQEPIPKYLTPDADRGIPYSDEIIEMKGKISLLPLQDEPEVEYKDDVFTHNKEFEVMNKIGTIRVQYDWQPRTDLEHVIEEHKLPALQPLIDYINHAGKLVSTKDDIIIFEYKGQMRHVIGIRATMLAMAKKCYPAVQDLRLETTKTADSFDY